MKRASGAQSRAPGYLFYSNSNGINFVTLEKLLEQKNKMSIASEDDGVLVFNDSNLFLYNRILNWSISGLDQIGLKSISGGTRLGWDTFQKKFIQSEFTYKESVQEHTILGTKTLFPDRSEHRTEYLNIMERDPKIIDNHFQGQ